MAASRSRRPIYEAMVQEVSTHIAPFAAAQDRSNLDRLHLLGTSGTVTTIAGVHLRLARYDRRRDRRCLAQPAGRFPTWSSGCWRCPIDDRVANPCIGAERADLVLAGCAILEAIRRAFPCTRLRVADRGLREGMLVQMMREDGVWDSPADAASVTASGSKGGSAISRCAYAAAAAVPPRRAPGSSVSSMIPMSHARAAKAIARAPPTS